jgi:hypothetical protein
MDDPADVSSQDGPSWYLLDEGSSTRNRKVVGSNPTSGSKPQLRALRCSPCLSTVNDCVDSPTRTRRLAALRRGGPTTTPTASAEPAADSGMSSLPTKPRSMRRPA